MHGIRNARSVPTIAGAESESPDQRLFASTSLAVHVPWSRSGGLEGFSSLFPASAARALGFIMLLLRFVGRVEGVSFVVR